MTAPRLADLVDRSDRLVCESWRRHMRTGNNVNIFLEAYMVDATAFHINEAEAEVSRTQDQHRSFVRPIVRWCT
jgi:hypothetical protein